MLLPTLAALTLVAQSSWDELPQLAAQFDPITRGATPGFAVGIIRDGELAAEGYFGLAELEHESPVGPDTRFYIGSISKQFTAAIILQLTLEGRVDLSAPITTYVSGLPSLYRAVTVADCLHHTGGVREYTSLLMIRGDDRRLQDRMGQADALALIAGQQGLDFEPGGQQRYSSSGYVLLAALIEAVEGEPFADVAQHRLFEPLGMTSTLFDDDHGAVVPGRAHAYQPDGTSWRRWLKHFDVVGDGGALTTVRDMAKWDRELSTGAVFGAQWRAAMHQPGRLRDGTPLRSGAGLWMTEHGGRSVVRHGGGLGGFIADQIRFPEAGLSLYVFANRNDRNAFQGWRLADALLPPLAAATASDFDLEDTRVGDAGDWVGTYFSDAINNRHFLRLNAAGGLDLHDGGDRFLAHLTPQAGGRFTAHPGGFTVRLARDGDARHLTVNTGRTRYTAAAYDNTPPADLEALQAFTGWYCSSELEAQVQYAIENGHFLQRYAQGQAERLFPDADNPNAGWNGDRRVWTGVTMVRFDAALGDPAHQVVIGDLRVSGVPFERCTGP
jgi:CubicO group peptidase (beta-lactamase class C family)